MDSFYSVRSKWPRRSVSDENDPLSESFVKFEVPDELFVDQAHPLTFKDIADRYFMPASRALLERMKQRVQA